MWLRRTCVAKIDLKMEGLDGLVAGKATVLFHGTTRSFKKFDLSHSRDDLVDQFYGKGIFLTPSKRVAWKYAYANRNIGFPPSIIGELARRNKGAAALLQSMVDHGYEGGWDKWMSTNNLLTGDDIDEFLDGFDPNLLNDVAEYIIGSKVESSGGDDTGLGLFNTNTGVPDYIYDIVDEMGIDSQKYRPKVYTVAVKVENPLITARKAQARAAPRKGYDSVVFHGSNLVDGVPEVAVYDPRKVKILRMEVA